MSNHDPIRAALERLLELDDTVPHNRPGWEKEWRTAIAAACAALAASPAGDAPAVPPAEGEVGELVEFLLTYGDHVMDEYGDLAEHDLLTRAAHLLQAQATELASWRSRAALAPVRVGERPWERPGWRDDEADIWVLAEPLRTARPVFCLPHWATPQPSQESGEME